MSPAPAYEFEIELLNGPRGLPLARRPVPRDFVFRCAESVIFAGQRRGIVPLAADGVPSLPGLALQGIGRAKSAVSACRLAKARKNTCASSS